ncbi:BZ3500_MvSof-1268-A1-R1_Chr6-2g08471 [Microbotryum saponariae]|uniref:V-type proton ATPase subunit G n=1 Tax=Microbotryum saponariae TaxID=289078 RepID=A0A2X0KNY6_9BASI|nr:BZ3500_MvSof-1268-A1-R1_Chr6-2g08471 [Microbotryum saponariae]SDA07748.1 BZ3501_MvSof-1269-A2-R1_Chr6-1g08185 [Microbotryum saponariae]
MAAQNSQGISALLDSEKEAAAIVQKAREYRTQRIKDARGEASKEIDALKKKADDEFSQFEQQVTLAWHPLEATRNIELTASSSHPCPKHSGDSSTSQTQVDEYTSDQLGKIASSFDQNKDKVVDDLLQRVVEVNPRLHKNYKP